MEFVFIGGGNMGLALASALIERNHISPQHILVVDPSKICRERAKKLGCQTQNGVTDIVGTAPILVLAVKPQQAALVMADLNGKLQSTQVVVSIMAGVPLAVLENGLAHSAVVRVMPNLPATIGLGMNVFLAPQGVSSQQKEKVQKFLSASGEAMEVKDEDQIDAATAVSGSGPAYVFYLAEHWMQAAEGLGFSPEEAKTLVQQTLLGAVELWKNQTLPASTLREQVTSKGGTTAAALESFQKGDVGAELGKGVKKAYKRAKELAKM